PGPSLVPSTRPRGTFGLAVRCPRGRRRVVPGRNQGERVSIPSAASPSASGAERLRRIRRRLVVGLLVPFCGLMGAATLEGFWDADGAPTRQLVALLVLLAGALTVPAFMAIVARGVLREAAAMDLERSEIHELYGQARRAALLDGLTGLGNHR